MRDKKFIFLDEYSIYWIKELLFSQSSKQQKIYKLLYFNYLTHSNRGNRELELNLHTLI